MQAEDLETAAKAMYLGAIHSTISADHSPRKILISTTEAALKRIEKMGSNLHQIHGLFAKATEVQPNAESIG